MNYHLNISYNTTITNLGEDMAGLTTHYIFGLNTYKHLTQLDLKSEIKLNNKAFAFGLQGPDIFYDFIPLFIIYGKNIARLMHTKRSADFFRHFIDNVKKINSIEDRMIAAAYLYGFLGHYILDSTTHPMIYYRTHYLSKPKDYLSKHLTLEADIDKVILNDFLELAPDQFMTKDFFYLSKNQNKIITEVLYKTIKQTYPEVKLSFNMLKFIINYAKVSLKVFLDSKGYKKRIISFLENNLIGCSIISPKFITDAKITLDDPLNIKKEIWLNPWNKRIHSDKSFYELFDQGLQEYNDILISVNDYMKFGSNYTELLNMIGNKSYHSGFSCK